MDSKAWYASKGVWGGIVGVLAGGLALLGHALSAETQATLVDNAVAIGTGVATIIGGAVAIYGRLKADKIIK
jgi:ABC-type antimicrobial peptide transport system permease subunit